MRNPILAALMCALPLLAGADNTFLIRNATVHPVSGPKLETASVLVVDGRIAEVGVKVTPPKGKIRIIEGKGLHVWPGMIDSGSMVGLSEIASVRETNDTGEIGEFNPQVRAIAAVHPESEHIPVVRANGITTLMVVPGIGGGGRAGGTQSIIGGQTALIHLDGWTWEQMQIRPSVAVYMAWPAIPVGGRGDSDPGAMFGGGRRTPFSEARRTQELQVRRIQEFFDKARHYRQAKAAGDVELKPDLKFEALLPVLEGKKPLMVVAVREREIREAVAWAAKENIRIVLAGIRKPGRMVEEIAKQRIPVILGTTQTTTLDEDDSYDSQFALPAELQKAGVKFAFGSFDVQFARNLPYEASQAVPFGLGYDEALRAVTLTAAEIWGIADNYGSIEKGKTADLVITNGDLLEVSTEVRQMFIQGEEVDLESKHTRLYKKYLARP